MKPKLKKVWWLISIGSIIIAITALLASPQSNQLDCILAVFMAVAACPLIPIKDNNRAVIVLSFCICNFLLLIS